MFWYLLTYLIQVHGFCGVMLIAMHCSIWNLLFSRTSVGRFMFSNGFIFSFYLISFICQKHVQNSKFKFTIQNLFIAHKKSYHINSNTSWNSLVQKSQKKQCLYMPDPCADAAATNNKIIIFQMNGFKILIPIRVHNFLPPCSLITNNKLNNTKQLYC